MSVIKRFRENRLAKLIHRPGGITLGQALASAEANLDSVRDRLTRELDLRLEAVQSRVAALKPQPEPAELEAIYDLANEVLALAAPCKLPEVGEAAFSLCDLIDRMVAADRFDLRAVEVHAAGLRLLRSAPPADPAGTAAVLSGLRDVVQRLPKPE